MSTWSMRPATVIATGALDFSQWLNLADAVVDGIEEALAATTEEKPDNVQ